MEFHGSINGQNVFAGTRAETIAIHLNQCPHTTNEASDYDAEVRKCRDALFLTDAQVDRESLISTKGKRVVGTCEWITKNELYRSWLGNGTQPLWISGGPGKGKTMLSIFLTEELDKLAEESENTELFFYFCGHQDEKRNTAAAILRGLLYQIITKRRKLLKHVLPYFDTSERGQFTVSSLEALWIIFRKILQDPDLGTNFCVLDGLDECDEDSLRSLLVKFVDFYSSNSSQPIAGVFKLMIVSREVTGLQTFPQLKLDPDSEEQVTSDIERFIAVRVQELSRIEGFNHKICADVQSTLLKRAEGTFLWVGFVMNELVQKRTCTEVLETLHVLPKGLPAIYGRILLQIESDQRHISSQILRWVTTAFRPLTLEELAAAIDIRSSVLISRKQAIRDRIALCGSLLKIRIGARKFRSKGHHYEVSVIHQSVKDYLLRKRPDDNPILEEFRVKADEAHFMVAKTCLDHIEILHQVSPLLHYAKLYWPEHTRSSSAYADKLFDTLRPFFSKGVLSSHELLGTYFLYKTSGVSVDRYPDLHDRPSLLQIASYLGIFPWVQKLLEKRDWKPSFRKLCDEKDRQGSTPLFYAALEGHEAVVRLLLEHGAKVNRRNKRGKLVLAEVAGQGNEAMVKLLLDYGADVNRKTGRNGRMALQSAAQGGYKEMVQLLLDHGADVNGKTRRYGTALRSAAWHGHKEIVQLLLDHGADVNGKAGRYDDTPLQSAAWIGHKEMVQLLLDHGADVMARSGQRAIKEATLRKNWEVVHMLERAQVSQT